MTETKMDDVFKSWIIDIGFSESTKHEIDWMRQVLNINKYWDTLVRSINRLKIEDCFKRECAELKILCDDYDIDEAIENVLTIWRIELMVSVANMIAQFYTDEIPDKPELVRWNSKTNKPEFIYELFDL